MKLLAPLYLWGLIAATVPWIIHFFSRRWATRVAFSATRFLKLNKTPRSARWRLKQWLILAVRSIVVIAFVSMLSRPYGEVAASIPNLGHGPQSVVLILDDSLSMQRRVAQTPLFALAKKQAQQTVTLLAGHSEITVLLATKPTLPLVHFSRTTPLLRWAISRASVTTKFAAASDALSSAAQLLKHSSSAQRRIIFFTDMSRHGLPNGVPKEIESIPIDWVDLAASGRPENYAVVGLQAVADASNDNRGVQFDTKICNYSDLSRELTISLQVDRQTVGQWRSPVLAQTCINKMLSHQQLRRGRHQATVTLSPRDNLPQDDIRSVQFEVHREVAILLINGDPSTAAYQDELVFLRQALSSVARTAFIPKVTAVTVAGLDRYRFDMFDVIILCNVATLSSGKMRALQQFVTHGGAVMISMGSRVDPVHYNRHFASLIGAQLRDVTTSASRIGWVDARHAMFAMPARSSVDEFGGVFGSARYEQVMRIAPTDNLYKAEYDVLMRLQDRSPLLLQRLVEKGVVWVYLSTLDPDWNDLPLRPAFVPFVHRLVAFLGNVSSRGEGGRDVDGDGEKSIGQNSLDGRESDVRKHMAPVMTDKQRLSQQIKAVHRVEWWHVLGIVLVVGLLIESFLTRMR